MHLNLKGNATTTRNEHNTVMGKPHFHQNQQRRTPGATHQSSQLASTKPTTTTDSQRGKDTFDRLRRPQPCTGEGHTTRRLY
ncbi:hypothetical protein Taro_024187 [Colocasia esculenta]|uniref:Uncharacterized protein n=1 Tax=Colocasia esculenta TaxID=4460 RepID=A0A843VJM3_COLES|nr:hypothetical protein [Colocasia esculenta]